MTNRKIVHIEYALTFTFLFFIYMKLDYPIWLFFVLLLVPDLTMSGYAVNKKIGAVVYNFGHTFIFPLLLALMYLYLLNDYLLIVSIIWMAHICMDRTIGAGLKYQDSSFTHTHLQRL
ncbi:DUF4260 domain-containing protein [Ureibacillus sinduriensis]|uniref:Membrane protein n=1 Tax=Ureibacillus sinduriensis BLB-1 = JCM 15800 TaxID=1384057 RepID=A0A0A3HSM0_9BACL|nr:DUF4260 domain-containing protein [Ureibacillus sinduriensis]KGR75419.1 membrane protein [Ureibacillus sinduriensis BLB-1 = JCM 15800]